MAERILVVDDDPMIRMTLQLLLEDEGYEVVLAVDGQDGLNRVEEQRPDLIILDMMMPQMDGYTFAEQLREREREADVPVLVLTADGRAQQKAAQVGAAGGIEKPFDAGRLLTSIGRILESHAP